MFYEMLVGVYYKATLCEYYNCYFTEYNQIQNITIIDHMNDMSLYCVVRHGKM